jgi:thiol-disulfide isomerase/thioredoxin
MAMVVGVSASHEDSRFRRRKGAPMLLMRRAARSACVAVLSLLMQSTWAQSPLDLSAYRGRVLYLDFWASWCAPCQKSFPWMESMHNSYARDGLAIVAVNVDRNRQDADRFLATRSASFDLRFDPQGLMAEAFKVKGMPTSVLIDRKGIVRFTHIGFRPIDAPAYEAQIRQILAEK